MPTNILMPALSPTMEEGTLARWLVAAGDGIQPGDVIAEIETDKATMELEVAEEGTIGQLLVPEGTAGVRVNAPIATLLQEGESGQPEDIAPALGAKAGPDAVETPFPTPQPAPAPAPARTNHSGEGRVLASPLARRIAADKGIDLRSLTGSGPGGRIIKTDVEAAVAAPPPPPREAPPTPQPRAVSEGTIKLQYADRPLEEVPLDAMRRTIAVRLSESKGTIPHFYLRREVRLDDLLALREQLNGELAERDVKLSVNDFVIKAAARALQEVPDCNMIWADDRMLRFQRSDIAVAVAIEGGLLTPVLRDADVKSLSALSLEMRDLATRARGRKLLPADYTGGVLSVSNLGMMGIENFDAIINPPQSAILAVGAALRKPIVAADGEIRAATVMSLTLSVDHRVIDGALGARLLAALVRNLESPLLMLV
jgi:pyruvate dehydrogenase E2 component (dihydrolipoamide acetyltransferase)